MDKIKYRIYKSDFYEFINSKSSWWLYIILTTTCFVICINEIQIRITEIIHFNINNIFNFNRELAYDLIDKRILNISAIFSISFIINGFIINNLKKFSEEIYDFVYKEIYLFPTLYFTLSIIAHLIILSTIRHSISEATFTNAFIMGSFLVLIVIIFIGIQFKRVISIIKSKGIYKTYYKALYLSALKVFNNHKSDFNMERIKELKGSLDQQIKIASIKGDYNEVENILKLYLKICSNLDNEDEN